MIIIYRNHCLVELEKELENMNEINHSLVVVAATIYNHEQDYESALRVLKDDDTLEGYVLLLKIKTYIYNFIVFLLISVQHCL